MLTRRITFITLLSLVFCGSFAVWAEKPLCSTATVQTSSGQVCGMTSKVNVQERAFSASAYLGIPYAMPPTGDRRWQYSTQFSGSGSLQATAYGNECPQSLSTPPSATSSSQCKDGTSSLGLNQSEDCLYLNVWAPNGVPAGSNLPVMVFIHGGAFALGSGGAPPPSAAGTTSPGSSETLVRNLYDGTYLASTGRVIVVTFNYRLGVFGFLAQGGNYNFGFADQLLALNWVQKNIASFGGNPHNVTLFGESAGAMSVGLHALSSPKSSGLFQAAIMESNPLGLPYKSTKEAHELSEEFCSRGSSLCSTTTSACDLIKEQSDFMKKETLHFLTMPDLLMWAPAVDNTYVTGQPIASASNLSVPLILGANHDEGNAFVYLTKDRIKEKTSLGLIDYDLVLEHLFGRTKVGKIRSRYECNIPFHCDNQLANVLTDYLFTCANRYLATQATQGANSQPLYLYQFNQVSSFNFWSSPPLSPQMSVPKCAVLVCHADELPYVFNTAGQLGFTFNPQEEKLAQAVGGYWTSFASSHNLDRTWPLFKPDSTNLLLSESSSTRNDPLDATANCSTLWDGIGYENAQIHSRLLRLLKTPKTKISH